jgi:hypothetical protein
MNFDHFAIGFMARFHSFLPFIIVYVYFSVLAKVHICGRVIQAWEIYIEMRHTKKALYRKADGVFRDNIRR